jgi:hypothetical protein
MKPFTCVIAAALGVSAMAFAYANEDAADSAHARHAAHMHHSQFSAEHAAMHNLIVAALAVKTGRSQDDIAKLFKDNAPPDVGRQLGLDEDAMHTIFANAHRTLIERMQAARLITPDQAEKLKAAPLPMHGEAHEHGTREVQ